MGNKIYMVETIGGSYLSNRQPIFHRHIVVADSYIRAGQKIRKHYGRAIGYRAEELEAKNHFSLEMRLEILEEAFGTDKIIR